MTRKAIIVGAGIGGLSCGLALALRGWQVEVLEKAPEISEVGAGLQISPNGMRLLDSLGVTPLIEDALFEPPVIELRLGQSFAGKTGRRVFSLPMKDVAAQKWGARFAQIHRADLHKALMRRLGQVAGAVVKTGQQVTGYVQEKNGASVYLEGADRRHGDLIIGADGIHSAIRTKMLGPDRPRFTGNVAWRLVVPTEALGDVSLPEGGCIWAGPGKHAVTTRICGGSEINFVGIVEQDSWQEEGWSLPGAKEDLAKDFDGWDDGLQHIIAAAEQPFRWALHDRAPLPTWVDGAVVLLGDAAHPMLPSMAQGAVQALEDAVVLAEIASSGRDLKSYEALRKPRTSAVQARSSKNLRLFHRAGFAQLPLFFGPLWAARRFAPSILNNQQNWIYAYDAEAAATGNAAR